MIVAGLWILFSGKLTSGMAHSREALALLEVYKGWFFVTVTGVGLYYFIYRQVAKIQHEAERARISEARFQQLFRSQLIGLALVDNESGCINEANQGFQKLFGYGPADFPLPWTSLVSEGRRKRDAERWQEASTTGVIKREERTLLRKDGRSRSVLVGGISLLEPRTNLSLIFVIDIREQKRAERELRKLLEELEERVQERTAELKLATVRAQSADRLKSVFLATMSHELRTPLNSIIGFTGLLKRGLAGPINSEQTKQLGMIQNSARHLLDLINDVLDISKIDADQLDLFIENIEVEGVVKNALNMTRPLAEAKGLSLESRVASVAALQVDRRRLEQILLNLLSNAVKFTQQGAVTLTVEEVGSAVRFDVSDTGLGIAANNLDLIFDPFTQVESGSSRSHDGTGLGLPISRKLAEVMGGTITVGSEFGKGSTFRVEIPRKTINLMRS